VIKHFADWLYITRISQLIRDTIWVIPTVQSVHIVSISVLMGAAIVVDLKLTGLVAKTDSSSVVFRRYMPWLWSSLSVLLLTGLIMVVGEPNRELLNWVFWSKMTLVAIAFVLTLVVRIPMLRGDFPQHGQLWGLILKPLGLLSLAIWILIIFCGRWIAYTV
jgi:hypothetical protein